MHTNKDIKKPAILYFKQTKRFSWTSIRLHRLVRCRSIKYPNIIHVMWLRAWNLSNVPRSIVRHAVYMYNWCPMVFSVVLSLLLLSIWKITAHHQNEKWDVSRILIQFYCLFRMAFIKMGIETCTFTERYWCCFCCCCCHCVYYLHYNNSSRSSSSSSITVATLLHVFCSIWWLFWCWCISFCVACHPNDQLLLCWRK